MDSSDSESSGNVEDIKEFEITNLVNKVEEAIKYNKSLYIYSVNYYFKNEDEQYIDKVIEKLKKLGYEDITRNSGDGEHIIIKW